MLERMKNVLKNRKRNDKGFSLVELAVVIVIIGILVAIAVPVFSGLQSSANDKAVEAAASNGAAMVAAEIATTPTSTKSTLDPKLLKLVDAPTVTGVTVAITTASDALGTFCVTATGAGTTAKKGPGC